MKRKFVTTLCVMLAVLMSCTFMFAGCNLFGGGEASEYIIQYTDDTGTHQLTVTYGMPYSIESIPYQYGYEFLGLYDAETGGTQYVSANGSSLSPYNDKKNIVLFPRFKAIDYTVILDYQGAEVTGERSLTVPYNSTLPELPKNLVLDHSEFTGWFTAENGNGVQIADKYGLLPVVSVLNEINFDLSDANRRVFLYAGFELETYTVTFNFGEGRGEEEVKVPYNTPISQVVPKTRNAEGEAVLVWSRQQNDMEKTAVFDGRVTGDMVLYAAEWAPVIELNVNGGNEVTPVVARAGATIALPTPTKSLAKFLYWETVDGEQANLTVMPETSTTLKAVWQAKIEFNTNGGTGVTNISEAAGTAITLPTPTREDYIFAGWYTTGREKYERTTMPSEGIALKAGWYKAKSATLVVLSGSQSVKCTSAQDTFMSELTMDFSSYLPSDFEGAVVLSVKWKEKNTDATQSNEKAVAVSFYTQRTISDVYKLGRKYTKHNSSDYSTVEINLTGNLNGNKVYVAIACDSNATGWLYNGYVSDMRVDITYPDVTYLYL